MKLVFQGTSVGMFIGLVCSIIMSYAFGDGAYYPMSTYSATGSYLYNQLSEPTILIIALVSWALIGIGFAFAGKIFEHERWSTLKMTIIHFFIVILFFFPLSVLSGWYPLNLKAFLSFVIIFVVIYSILWTILFFVNEQKIKKINQQLNK